MFAALTFDREPLRAADLPAGLIHWVQAAGGFAAFGLVLFLVAGLPRWRAQDRAAGPPEPGAQRQMRPGDILLTAAGLFAIVAAGLPFLLEVTRLRGRRIYALA